MITRYHVGVLGQQHLGLELDAGLSGEESAGLGVFTESGVALPTYACKKISSLHLSIYA